MGTKRQTQERLFLTCRTLGHAWFVIPADSPSGGGDPFWMRCERCLTERHDTVSYSSGALITRQYVYPDGYRDAFDEQFSEVAPTRQDFRRLLIAAVVLDRREARNVRNEARAKLAAVSGGAA